MLSKKYKLMHPVHNVVTTLPIGQLLIALKRLYTYEIGIVSESFGPGQKILKGSMWLKITQKMNWNWNLVQRYRNLFSYSLFFFTYRRVKWSFTHLLTLRKLILYDYILYLWISYLNIFLKEWYLKRH